MSSRNSDHTVLALVGCGSAKQDEPAPAEELYTSNYFGLKDEWADHYADRKLIFSAKYGFLEPEREVDPYSVTVGGENFDEDEFVTDVGLSMEIYRIHHADDIVLLMGKDYIDVFQKALESDQAHTKGGTAILDEVTIHTPFQDAGCSGNGDQMGWLRNSIDSNGWSPADGN